MNKAACRLTWARCIAIWVGFQEAFPNSKTPIGVNVSLWRFLKIIIIIIIFEIMNGLSSRKVLLDDSNLHKVEKS